MAMAASTSADSNNDYRFDVFINNRGPYTKPTLASLLYRSLIGKGLRVFLDIEQLKQGENISDQIEGAIRSASVHIAIFSPFYAESRWCLNELVLMLESGAPIIPVFFRVQPSEVRSCNGVYGQSLRNHAERYKLTTIKKWRYALSQVADISGYTLEASNGNEGELAEKVVQSVLRRAAKGRSAAKDLIGLDEKVKDFENKVFSQNHRSAKPQVVGIVGVGGVGKTTLAKELLNRKKAHYSKSCFLSNVRENARLGLLNYLQRQLLKSLTGTDALINSIDEGKEALRKHLSSCRVLMIIDDVDKLNQIHALFPVQSNFLSDSLVVITSRDKKVIRSSGVENAAIYELEGLDHQHSRQLFCAYAFNQPNPIEGFGSLVDDFLKPLKGLPLFLIVFGAHLSGNENQLHWQQQLERLQQIPPGETQEILQIGYDSLDSEAKQMFLDAACFFIGQKGDTAIRIWEGSGWHGRSGFVTLRYKCFLELDSENNIDMHDHLRDFGRAVAVADASLPPRLLHSTTHIKKQLSGRAVRGIKMVLGEDNDDVDALGAIDVRSLELLDTENGILERLLTRPEEHVLRRLIWLLWNKCPTPSLPSWVPMESLRVPQVFGSKLHGILERLLTRPEEHVPRRLIWLRWNKCPTASLPSWVPMESLRVLQVFGSKLQTLWEDNSQAPLRLRELEINAPLSNIPESIGQLEYLERIVIGKFSSGGQVNLTKLPEGFCHLLSLKELVLTECSKMKSLQVAFDSLGNLQHIDLPFCRNLERLPDSFEDLRRLQHINLSDCHDLVTLPDSIDRLWRLQHIDLQGCHHLERLPDSFGALGDLRHINLSGCHDLQRLPDSFGELRYLQHIDLQACHNLEKLPDSFAGLKNLEDINLSNCHNLKSLPESFCYLSNLQHIDLSGCHNLERLPNNFRNLKKLKYFDVEGCANLIIDSDEINEISVNLPLAHRSQLEQLYD